MLQMLKVMKATIHQVMNRTTHLAMEEMRERAIMLEVMKVTPHLMMEAMPVRARMLQVMKVLTHLMVKAKSLDLIYAMHKRRHRTNCCMV